MVIDGLPIISWSVLDDHKDYIQHILDIKIRDIIISDVLFKEEDEIIGSIYDFICLQRTSMSLSCIEVVTICKNKYNYTYADIYYSRSLDSLIDDKIITEKESKKCRNYFPLIL